MNLLLVGVGGGSVITVMLFMIFYRLFPRQQRTESTRTHTALPPSVQSSLPAAPLAIHLPDSLFSMAEPTCVFIILPVSSFENADHKRLEFARYLYQTKRMTEFPDDPTR